MLGELVPTGGGDPIPLIKSKLLVGRRDECDITLRFPNVSSHHCELELINGYWLVRDLNSSNGIKVNGIRCPHNWLLPGDEITFARHKFEIKYTAVGPPPIPFDGSPESLAQIPDAGSSRRASELDSIDISRSLMEKAGLEKRPTPPRNTSRPASAPAKPAGNSEGSSPAKSKPDSDESLALKWLSDE